MSRIHLCVGFTEPSQTTNYFPMADGYREGAAQHIVSIDVEGLRTDDPEAIAEAVFTATNAPWEVIEADSNATAVMNALIDSGESMRSLSVGDTVTIELSVGSRTYAVDHVGWQEVAA